MQVPLDFDYWLIRSKLKKETCHFHQYETKQRHVLKYALNCTNLPLNSRLLIKIKVSFLNLIYEQFYLSRTKELCLTESLILLLLSLRLSLSSRPRNFTILIIRIKLYRDSIAILSHQHSFHALNFIFHKQIDFKGQFHDFSLLPTEIFTSSRHKSKYYLCKYIEEN